MTAEKDTSTQIHDISTYADLAMREDDMASAAYQQYAHAFETLLHTKIPAIDDKKREQIHEIIKVIFLVYSEQGSIQTERLTQYIENLLANIQANATYLQHWSMLSVIDALLPTDGLDTDSQTSSESLDELIESSTQALDEILEIDQQKAEILSADDYEDNDLLDQEMTKLADLSFQKMYAKKSTSDHKLKESAFLIEFSKKFHNILTQFQEKSNLHGIKDEATLKTATSLVTENILELYKTCFQNGVNEGSLTEFEQASQSIISNWAYWNDADLSETNQHIASQAFTKLMVAMQKLVSDTRQNLSDNLFEISPKAR